MGDGDNCTCAYFDSEMYINDLNEVEEKELGVPRAAVQELVHAGPLPRQQGPGSACKH